MYKEFSKEQIEQAVKRAFPKVSEFSYEQTKGNVSSNVYKININNEIYYLRVNEDDEPYACEVSLHKKIKELGVKAPEVLYFEDSSDIFSKSFMIVSEIKGKPIKDNDTDIEQVLYEAGKDIALVNTIKTKGFGWLNKSISNDFIGYKDSYESVLCSKLEESIKMFKEIDFFSDEDDVITRKTLEKFRPLLAISNTFLCHGDFDYGHVFADKGFYTGIIDFSDAMSVDQIFDLAHFSICTPELLPFILKGYKEIIKLPEDFDVRLSLTRFLFSTRKFRWVIKNLNHKVETLPEHKYYQSIKRDLEYFKKLV